MKKVIVPFCFAAVASSLFATGVTVVPANEMGILEVRSPLANTIVSVPFEALGVDAGNIRASNLVKTANLTDGDKLIVFTPGSDNYKAWELIDGEWAGVYSATIDANGNPTIGQTPASDSITLASGSGFWLYRQNPTSNGEPSPFYLFGQPKSTPTTDLSAGLNLVAPPDDTGVAYDLKSLKGMVSGDSVIIPTDDLRITYTYDGKDWGRDEQTVEEVTRHGITDVRVVVTRVVPEKINIVPGTGFWYNSKVDKTITW